MRFVVAGYAIAGAAAVGAGLWQLHPAAAFIWGGAYALFDAWRLGNVQPR